MSRVLPFNRDWRLISEFISEHCFGVFHLGSQAVVVIAQDILQSFLNLGPERSFLGCWLAEAARATLTSPEALLFLIREVVRNA
jgi:hypothetical protein